MWLTAIRGQPIHAERMAAPVNTASWVEWMGTLMGGVSRQTESATFPPDRYYCLLDELPVHLVQRNFRRNLHLDNGEFDELRLSPECRIYSAEQIPEEFVDQPDLLSGFALQGTIAWVRDHESRSLHPFWLSPRLEILLRSLPKGEPFAALMDADTLRLLKAAGILISDGAQEKAHERHQLRIQRSAELFRTKGYAPIESLIHPFHVAALRRYYRYMIRSGNIYLGDHQSSRRYVAHNDPVARFFHRQIVASLSEIAGEPLKPSYVYMASYLSGAELKKHTDREQCEFSITMCLDFSPEPEMASSWPIQLDAASGPVKVYQMIGDGLAYRGTKLPHYRGKLPEGQSSTSIFFHYVAADYSGPLD